MRIVDGDLIALALRGEFDVIVHGCNCQCAMGAGIARTIRERFPEAYAADRATKKGDAAKLGTFSSADVSRPQARFVVVNAYTQWHWRGSGVKLDYAALDRAMRSIGRRFSGRRIGYPAIGAGLAGGDWNRISAVIDAALDGQDHTFVRYAG